MGKTLKGKECGKGICQRMEYTARLICAHEKHFDILTAQLANLLRTAPMLPLFIRFAMKRASIAFARTASYLCCLRNRKRYAAQGPAAARLCQTAVDRYVHATDGSLKNAILKSNFFVLDSFIL